MSAYLDKLLSLTPPVRRIICDKATEYPHSGAYHSFASQQGSYLCRRCGIALFRAKMQFHSGCGWPSFDDNILQTVSQIPDKDGLRTEILCSRCDAHLGHVFTGEHFTAKNLRHCVNSAALDFVANDFVLDTEEAILAGGCFWGIEHFMKQLEGVLKVESGYIGGKGDAPSYEQVCQGNSGHYEAVRVVFDRQKTDFAAVTKRFFEIHDPTQSNGQGPDIGHQYQSAIFYYTGAQKKSSQTLIDTLKTRGYAVSTKLLAMQIFWPAEDYHQNYYQKHQKTPYCHQFTARFD